jgi:hypothetical protein
MRDPLVCLIIVSIFGGLLHWLGRFNYWAAGLFALAVFWLSMELTGVHRRFAEIQQDYDAHGERLSKLEKRADQLENGDDLDT